MDVDVVLNHPVRSHLVLRHRRLGMTGSRLAKRRDATGPEDSDHLAQHGVRIWHVMERVEADNSIDARVRQVDASAIELEKDWRGPLADHRQAAVHLARDAKRRG